MTTIEDPRSRTPRLLRAGPAGPMIVALVAGTIFVVLRLASYDWNASGFVHAGGRFVDPAKAPTGLIVRDGEVGFDGTGFYRLALDPFTRSVDDHGIVLDLPAFRQQRILYPLIVWGAAGGGRAGAVPWALVAVNLAAFAGVGWLGGAIAQRLGRSAWWGLLVVAYPGFAVSLGLDTAEIVAAAFALAGVVALTRKRPGWATAAFTAAMFTRETTLLFVFGAAAVWVLARRGHREAPLGPAVFAVPLIAYASWQALLWHQWGILPLRQGSGVDISFPLAGLVQMVPDWPRTDASQAAFHYALAGAMVIFVVAVARELRGSKAPEVVRWAAVPALVLTLLYSDDIWLHHWGFLRAFTEPYLLGALVLIGAQRERLDRFVVASCGLWTAIAVNLVAHP